MKDRKLMRNSLAGTLKDQCVDEVESYNGKLSKPNYLAGAERSRTTTVRLMLDQHPLVGWAKEFEHVVDKVLGGDGWPDIDLYVEWLETCRIFTAVELKIRGGLSYPKLADDFLRK